MTHSEGRTVASASTEQKIRHEDGIAAELFTSCLELLRNILSSSSSAVTGREHRSLKRIQQALFIWGETHGVEQGSLDAILQKSGQLMKVVVAALGSILKHVFYDLVYTGRFDAREHAIIGLLEKAHCIERDESDSESEDSDADTSALKRPPLNETLSKLSRGVQRLVDLHAMLSSPIFDLGFEASLHIPTIDTVKPHDVFSNGIRERFPDAEQELVEHLGKANLERYQYLQVLRSLAQEVGNEPTVLNSDAVSKPQSSKFQDSGYGTGQQGSVAAASAYAPSLAPSAVSSFVSSVYEGGSSKFPSLPKNAITGEAFECSACGAMIIAKRKQEYRKHLIRDLRPYLCVHTSCSFAHEAFDTRRAWMDHMTLDHSTSESWETFACILCSTVMPGEKHALLVHLAKHLEDISLSALLPDVESENGSDSGEGETESRSSEVKPRDTKGTMTGQPESIPEQLPSEGTKEDTLQVPSMVDPDGKPIGRKALPGIGRHTSTELNEAGDEYVPCDIDEGGEKKVAPNGTLLGGRQYLVRTFVLPNRGDKLFMLGIECARVLKYRDSYLLLNKNRSLFKIIANQVEKDFLIQQDIIPYTYRARHIAVVTARSMFRQFGSRLIENGRRVRDDYFEQKARRQGFTEEDLPGDKWPGARKMRELQAAEAKRQTEEDKLKELQDLQDLITQQRNKVRMDREKRVEAAMLHAEGDEVKTIEHLLTQDKKDQMDRENRKEAAKLQAQEDGLKRLQDLLIQHNKDQMDREKRYEAERAAETAAKLVAEKRAEEEKKRADEKAKEVTEAAMKAVLEAELAAAKAALEEKEKHDKEIAEAKQKVDALKAAIKKAKDEAKALRPTDDMLKAPIRFIDAVGRKFSFPWHLCQTWTGMEALIHQAFLHVDVVGPHVREGHYDLIGPDGEIILPQVWETMVKPDWSITMHMWPIASDKDKTPPGSTLG